MRQVIFAVFVFSISARYGLTQNFKIDKFELNGNLTFDSLRAKESEILITIFYKNFGKNDCAKTSKFNFSNEDCNVTSFIEKLKISLEKSSFVCPTRIQIFYWDESKKNNTYYIEDRIKKKSFNNKNFLAIEDLMAFVDFANVRNLIPTDSLIINLNKMGRTQSVGEKQFVNSIFEFTKTIKRTGIIPFPCPSELRALCKDTITASGGSCHFYPIPTEDMFLEHLVSIFKPNLVINLLSTKISNLYNLSNKKIDSLLGRDSIQNELIEKLKLDILKEQNYLSLSMSNSLFNITFAGNSLPTSISADLLNNLALTFSSKFKSPWNINISINSLNARGNLNVDEFVQSNQEILNDGLTPMIRKTHIVDLVENWSLKNTIGLNVGFGIEKQVSKKIKLTFDVRGGKILPSNLETQLVKGIFHYRATVPGITDELMQINSLNLKDNVTYSNSFDQKFAVSGFNSELSANLRFLILKNVSIHGSFNLGYVHLTNLDYDPNRFLSNLYGEFNSSFHYIKSFSIMPFSLGIGAGIYF